jgi:hypothetical protein
VVLDLDPSLIDGGPALPPGARPWVLPSDAICAAAPMLGPKVKRMGATMVVSEGAGDRYLRWTPLWLVMAEERPLPARYRVFSGY